MRGFCIYTRLQFKRMLHYVPFIFLVTLVIALCLALALMAIVNTDNADEDQKKVQIGVVGDFENSYLGIGISAMQSFDSSRFFLDVAEFSEEEAKKKLLNKEITGYVVIPEGFVDNALMGEVGKLTFVTFEGGVEITDMFKQEVLELISCILVESQKGVYGLQNELLDRGESIDTTIEKMNQLSFEYVELVISRSAAMDVEVIGVSENLTFGGYMLTAMCILMMLLFGIVCCPLFVKNDYALPKLMRANRRGVCTQTLGEYLSFALIMAVITVVLLLFTIVGAGSMTQLIPEFGELDNSDILAILIKFIPAMALIAALQYLLFQLSDSVVSGVLLQFASAVILGYISGCFYPINFFPKALRVLSSVLPSGIARGYLASLITDTASVWQVVAILGYTAILLVISGFIRYRHITEA